MATPPINHSSEFSKRWQDSTFECPGSQKKARVDTQSHLEQITPPPLSINLQSQAQKAPDSNLLISNHPNSPTFFIHSLESPNNFNQTHELSKTPLLDGVIKSLLETHFNNQDFKSLSSLLLEVKTLNPKYYESHALNLFWRSHNMVKNCIKIKNYSHAYHPALFASSLSFDPLSPHCRQIDYYKILLAIDTIEISLALCKYREAWQYAQAIKLENNIGLTKTDAYKFYYFSAIAAHFQKEFTESNRRLNEYFIVMFSAQQPVLPYANYLFGLNFFAQGKLKEALHMLNPKYPESNKLRAEILELLGQNDEAFDLCESLIKNEPTEQDLSLVKAKVLLKRNQSSEAMRAFNKGIRNTNDFYAILINLKILMAQSKKTEAYRLFENQYTNFSERLSQITEPKKNLLASIELALFLRSHPEKKYKEMGAKQIRNLLIQYPEFALALAFENE